MLHLTKDPTQNTAIVEQKFAKLEKEEKEQFQKLLPALNGFLNLNFPSSENEAYDQNILFSLLNKLVDIMASEDARIFVLDDAQYLDDMSWQLIMSVLSIHRIMVAIFIRPLSFEVKFTKKKKKIIILKFFILILGSSFE